jgi:hypothetical protein
MPHRELILSGAAPHAVRGHSPEIKKASQPVGQSHHLTSGGKADSTWFRLRAGPRREICGLWSWLLLCHAVNGSHTPH